MERHHGGSRIPCPGDDGRDLLRRLAERIVGKVCIALSCSRLRMTEQAADDRKAQAAARADARECVPQVVQARVLAEPGALPDEVPDVPKRSQMLARLVAGENPLALARLAQPID